MKCIFIHLNRALRLCEALSLLRNILSRYWDSQTKKTSFLEALPLLVHPTKDQQHSVSLKQCRLVYLQGNKSVFRDNLTAILNHFNLTVKMLKSCDHLNVDLDNEMAMNTSVKISRRLSDNAIWGKDYGVDYWRNEWKLETKIVWFGKTSKTLHGERNCSPN